MDLLNSFLNFVKEQELFMAQDRILLAVSGGKDSVLMAHLCVQAGVQLGIAHVNFQLRGAQAEGDELFVQDLAKNLSVPFHVKRVETRQYAAERGISIEMAARELRYDWFEELRMTEGYDYIALAHHQNDSVETVLLNLTKGTGIAGLHGILPKRGKLVRPLLFLTRAEIDREVMNQKLSYRDDESNASTIYQRNKIRLEVVPRLREINPSLERTFMENSQRFAELEELLYSSCERLRTQLFREEQEGVFRVEVAALKSLHPLRTLLYGIFTPFGFSAAVLEDLIRIWDRPDRTGKEFFSLTHRLLVDRDQLCVEKRERPALFSSGQLWPEEELMIGRNRLTLTLRPGNSWTRAREKAFLDADQLIFPLSVRSWQEGDSFQPLGFSGRKKLSDFFVSLKIPKNEKERIPLVLNGNGDILWVAPYRMDDRYKITDKTRNVAILAYVDEHGRR